MDLKDKIIAAYSEIAEVTDITSIGIYLQDDSDGLGAFIARWEYTKPIPDGLKLGK